MEAIGQSLVTDAQTAQDDRERESDPAGSRKRSWNI